MTDITHWIKHPTHYISHPSGRECIDVTRHHKFTVGNAIKYLWRAGQKDNRLTDLRKAAQYLEWAIEDGERVLMDSDPFLAWHMGADDIRPEDQIIYWILTDELPEAQVCLAELIEDLTHA